MAIDFYLEYRRIYFANHGREFPITREQWREWCSQPSPAKPLADIDFDYAKEREGDAQ